MDSEVAGIDYTKYAVGVKANTGNGSFCQNLHLKEKSADNSNTEDDENSHLKEKSTDIGKENWNETAGMTVDEKAQEIAKLSLVDLAKDKKLWVSDTGATRHMAKTKKGLINVRKASPTEGFTSGNGANARAAIVGNSIGSVGNTKIKVSDVTYCPTAKFNLFSTSLLLMNGWKMRGDKNSIIMTKEPNKVIKFNEIVKTAKGMLFCVRIKSNNESGMSAL